jgi:acetyl-CoA acetyltransferase
LRLEHRIVSLLESHVNVVGVLGVVDVSPDSRVDRAADRHIHRMVCASPFLSCRLRNAASAVSSARRWGGRARHARGVCRAPSGLNSGAAVTVLIEEAQAEARAVLPAARLVAWGIGAVEPGMFGLGPVPAVRQALERAGWRAADVERVEINEALAAMAIVVARELGFPEDIVTVEGGAIAHGHPIGASGAVLVTRLIHSMRRDALRRGVVTLCVGGGQGVALALEAIR